MISLSSLQDLQNIKTRIEQFKKEIPDLYNRMVHLTSLTRQLQFRYSYLACLLTNEDATEHYPNFASESVMNLFHQEVSKMKMSDDIHVVSELLQSHKHCGYDKICLLFLGISPEHLKGLQ
ncbi:hypothetical protein [Bacillus sp. Marseille-Q3570]|uniref:hypothetical protein n=1 Tax=Bacillus sp. Marseille-Q3570 TaxID=2963522 RepID=UPI0021B7BCC4|nr:hypothetical protein [Bacillus sp. Marseille-Q3570]